MNLMSYKSPTPSSRATMLEPRLKVLGARGHGNPGEGCGGLGVLVSRHHRLKSDGGCRTEVLQLLHWEPNSDNQKVVTALVRNGEATGEQET